MDQSPATIARLLTCVKEDLINLKAYFEKWDGRLKSHPTEKAICIDHRDIDIEVKTLLSQFQHSLRDLLNTLPEWKDVETLTMAQQVNQLTVGEMMSLKEATTASNSASRKQAAGAGSGGTAGRDGRDDLYKCINQLACKIAERSLPLFMGESGSPLVTPRMQKKSPPQDSPQGTSRSTPSDDAEEAVLPLDETATPKHRDSPGGSGSLHSSEAGLPTPQRQGSDPGPLQDQLLALRDKNAVEFIFNRAKNFSKYISDYVKNEEKRITGEVEHVRSLAKNYQGMVTALQPNQATQSNLYMPLQANLISYSKQFSERCREFESRNFAQCWDELEHLKRRNGVFDSQRRSLKDQWKEQLKKMSESRAHHDKLRTNYVSRCQTLEKVRSEESDVNAQLLASSCAAGDSNFGSSSEVDAAGSSPSPGASLTSVGPGGVAYGPLASSAPQVTASPAGGSADLVGSGPTKLKNKADKVLRQRVEAENRQREAEEDYRLAVLRLNDVFQETEEQRLQLLARVRELSVELERVFKQTNLVIKKNELDVQQKIARLHEHHIEEMETYAVGSMYSQAIDVYIRPRKEEFHVQQVAFEPYPPFAQGTYPDRQRSANDLVQLRRPGATPRPASHRSPPAGGIVEELEGLAGTPTSDRVSGRSSLYGPGEAEYDGTVGSMKTTLNEWASNIKNKFSIKSRRPPTAGESAMDGGPFSAEAEVKHARYILSRCIAEIEERGLKQIGLYRCSASVKATMTVMDNLQAEAPGIVDLSEETIFTLCGVIKSALKALSEPLTTFECYPEFLDIGKEAIASPAPSDASLVKRLEKTCAVLPEANKMTCGILFHHLKKVADHSADNQMTAANLGTCLSPTLLKPKSVRAASKADVGDMMDNPPRSRVIELLITHVEHVFGPRQEYIMDLDFSSTPSDDPPGDAKPRPSAISAVCENEVPPGPGSAPPATGSDSSASSMLADHLPAVRCASDGVVRASGASVRPPPTATAAAAATSRSVDCTDLQAAGKLPVPAVVPSTVLPKTATVSLMLPPPQVPGRTERRAASAANVEGGQEPGEIAFIDTDSTEDLSHSGAQHMKSNFKKAVKNLFRKRKNEDHLLSNGRSHASVGRSLEHLPHFPVAPPRPVERVASLHLSLPGPDDADAELDAQRRPHSARTNGATPPGGDSGERRLSVTRLGRTEGDGHSTPTSPVMARRLLAPEHSALEPRPRQHRHPHAHPHSHPQSHPQPRPPFTTPPSSPRNALRRRLSDADERKAEARAVVRDRHRAAVRHRDGGVVVRRDRSAPADRDRRRQLSHSITGAPRPPLSGNGAAVRLSLPPQEFTAAAAAAAVASDRQPLPPRIRSPLEPRRAADARAVSRCNFTVDDYREFRAKNPTAAAAHRAPASSSASSSSSPGDSPPMAHSDRSAGYGSLTPRRSHPEFV